MVCLLYICGVIVHSCCHTCHINICRTLLRQRLTAGYVCVCICVLVLLDVVKSTSVQAQPGVCVYVRETYEGDTYTEKVRLLLSVIEIRSQLIFIVCIMYMFASVCACVCERYMHIEKVGLLLSVIAIWTQLSL